MYLCPAFTCLRQGVFHNGLFWQLPSFLNKPIIMLFSIVLFTVLNRYIMYSIFATTVWYVFDQFRMIGRQSSIYGTSSTTVLLSLSVETNLTWNFAIVLIKRIMLCFFFVSFSIETCSFLLNWFYNMLGYTLVVKNDTYIFFMKFEIY